MKNRLMRRIKSHAHEMHVKLNVSTEIEMLEKLNMCSWVIVRHHNAIK